MRRGLITGVLAAFLVTACGGSAATSAPTGPVESALPVGPHTSTAFQPAVTFTVPDGWVLGTDNPTYLELHPVGSDVTGIHLFRDAQAASQDPACPTAPEPGVGRTSTELVTWMRGLKGLLAGAPAMVTVGGLRGLSIDLGIVDGWTQSCPFASGIPTVPLLSPANNLRWVMEKNERLRLYVLDLPAGGTVIVDIDAFDGTLIDALIRDALPIVKSMQFAGG